MVVRKGIFLVFMVKIRVFIVKLYLDSEGMENRGGGINFVFDIFIG